MKIGKQLMMDTSIYLPIEIITTILLLLPPKLVGQLMCVCKKWRNLIKNPRFLREYGSKAAPKGEDFILYMSMCDADNLFFRLLHEKTLKPAGSRLRTPSLPQWKRNITIVGSSNGILCLTELNHFGFIIHLCNPLIRKCRTLNRSSTINMWLVRNVVLGFSYHHHHQASDFKVLRITYGLFKKFLSSKIFGYDVCVEVYSLISDSWKAIEVGFFPWYLLERASEVVIHESLHWVAIGGGNLGGNLVILAFDLREEAFKEFALPPDSKMDPENYHLHFLGVFKDALSVLTYCPEYFGFGETICDLWLMRDYGKEESWTKVYRITWDVAIERPLKFTKHEEIIVMDDEQNVLGYNLVSRRTTFLGVLRAQSNFVAYTKSLVLLNETK